MKKEDAFCEHNIHANIICLQCASKLQAKNKAKPYDYEKEKLELLDEAEKLDW